MGAIDTSLGILYDMQVIVALLFGIGIVQAWFYFSTYLRKDHLILKLMIALIVILDIIQFVMITDIGYRYFVTDAVQVLQMLETGLLIQYRMDEIQLFFTGVIALVTQHFYCWRICMLMKANGVPYPYVHTAILSLVSLGANGTWFAYCIIASRRDYFEQLLDLRTLLTVTNSMSAAIDIILSLVMIFLLQTSKTGFRRSTDIINRLMIFTFSTGIPTAIFALLSEITARTNPDTLIYILFNAFSGRLYTNCILVNLNSRDYIRGTNALVDSTTDNMPLSYMRSDDFRSGTHNSDTYRINVETTTRISETDIPPRKDVLRSPDKTDL